MKKTSQEDSKNQPFHPRYIIFALSVSLLIVAIAAGYYQELYQQSTKRNSQLAAKITELSLFCQQQ